MHLMHNITVCGIQFINDNVPVRKKIALKFLKFLKKFTVAFVISCG